MTDQPIIRFICDAEDEGVIPPPQPALTALPDWFRRLPPVTPGQQSVTDTGLTVKRCMPFLDAMMAGWIIPLAATVKMEIADDGATVNTGWQFDRTLVSNHGAHQVAGNPHGARPPNKFHNFWTIRTAPGWSCLFVPPLNRPHPAFECFAGLVDTDAYAAPIHFPFVATGEDGFHVIERGTPLVQVIPFRRESLTVEIGAETEADADERRRIQRLVGAQEGWYRTEARADR